MKRDKPGRLPFRTISKTTSREGIPWTIVRTATARSGPVREHLDPTTFFVALGRRHGDSVHPHSEGIDKPMTEELARLRGRAGDQRKLEPRADRR